MASPTTTHAARQYLNWAREHIPESENWSEDQIRAAVQALMQAKAQKLTAQQAIHAAKTAAARAATASVPPIAPAPPGRIAGIARSVQQTTQFGGEGANLQVLNFELARSGAPSVRVQIRGALLYGTVNDGDEVVVQQPRGSDRFIQADQVFNRTTNAEVKAQKGFLAGLSSTEARWGKGPARVEFALKLVVSAFAIIFFLAIFTFLGWAFIHHPPWESDTHSEPSRPTVTHKEPSPPTWFCKDAPPGFGC